MTAAKLNRRVALALASSLVCVDWTRPAIALHLTGRLPADGARLANDLAAWLVGLFPKPYAPSAEALATALAAAPHLEAGMYRALVKRMSATDRTIAIRIVEPSFRPSPAFAGLDLPQLTTTGDLADHLALPGQALTRFADLRGLSNRTDNPFAPHYRFHVVPKASGGQRLIEEPKPFLKSLQRRLLRTILDPVSPHPAAFGFARGRSCIEAAAKHAGEEVILRFDLQDYFWSITPSRLFGLWRCLGYPEAVARHLTGLTTLATPAHVLGRLPPNASLSARHLPQGAPTSPALANLCTYTLDRRLAGLARRLDARYTRYADDITFSGDRSIAAVLTKAVPTIVADEGFVLNTAKTRVIPAHRRQTVTGIVVNRHTNLPRAEFDRLKAVLHRLSKTAGAPDKAQMQRLDGQIAWAEALNPRRGARLRAIYHSLSLP